MARNKKVKKIIKAWAYRDDSVFLCGMKKGLVLKKLGSSYAEAGPVANILDSASDIQIEDAFKQMSSFIDYMDENPIKPIECFGNKKKGGMWKMKEL